MTADFTPRTENGYIEDVCIHGFRPDAIHCCGHVDGNVAKIANAIICLDCEDYLTELTDEDYDYRLTLVD